MQRPLYIGAMLSTPNKTYSTALLLHLTSSRMPHPASSILPGSPGHFWCRLHAGDDHSVLDGEENDACELLRMLADFIKSELQTSFTEQSAAVLSSSSALQDVLSASMGGVPQASPSGPKPVKPHGDGMTKELSESLTVQNSSLCQQASESATGAHLQHSAGTSSDDRTAEPAGLSAESRSAGCADPNVRASPRAARVRATGQVGPSLGAWRARKSPWITGLAQELACVVCRRPISSTVSEAVALPLVLPAVQVSSLPCMLCCAQMPLH